MLLSPFECLSRNFILPESANYVFSYPFFFLRNLLYLIFAENSPWARTLEDSELIIVPLA